MNDTQTFWARMAARSKAVGPLATLEEPRSLVRLATASLWASAVTAILFAALLFAFDEPAAAIVAVVLAAFYIIGWVWYATTGSMFQSALIAVPVATAALMLAHLSLGGYANSGAFLLWGISLTVVASLVLGRSGAIVLVLIYTVVGITFGIFEETLAASREAPDPTLTSILFVTLLVGSLAFLAPSLLYMLDRLGFERERAEGLLLNVLPAEVAAELKQTGTTRARHHDGISVLFADIVGFTPMSAEMEPEEMVTQLNDVFTSFDTLAERHGCEKIRTIGDNYMIAAGLPTARTDHAQALCRMALDMLEYSEQGPLSFRIGINSGPAVAGVIGTRKFQYDVWGDTVNTASRMESHGEPGRIQISEATYQLIKYDFDAAPRGPIEIKGKGTLDTYWLNRAATPAGV